jgi:4-amino-4-deoxy-L-arabinose transferase-like glycosyltransferase
MEFTTGSSADKRLAVAVFATSVLVTLIFRAALPDRFSINESSDFSIHYDPLARNIAAGRGLVTRDGDFAAFYPPGYPLALAAIYRLAATSGVSESFLLSIFTLLCAGASATAIYLLGVSVNGPRAASVAALIWITYPFALWLTKQPNSETPFIAAFYAGFGLFLRAQFRGNEKWQAYMLSGVLIGLSMLIRPIAIGVWLVMIIISLAIIRTMSARIRLRLAGVFLGGAILAVLPWEIIAYVKTGKVVMLSNNGAIAMRSGLVFAVAEKSYREQNSIPALPMDVEELMRRIYTHYGELNTPGDVAGFMSEELVKRPAPVIKLMAIKGLRSWYGTDSQRYERYALLLQIPYLILIACGTVAAWRRGGAARTLALALWPMVIYFWGMTMLVTSTLRYMVPSMGLLFTLIPVIVASNNAAGKAPSDKPTRPERNLGL